MDDTGVREDIGGATGLRVEALSERKRRILDGVAAGKSNGVLAQELGISVDGVKWHVSELLGDTGCEDRHELAAWWRRVRGPVAPAALTLGWPSRSTLAGFGRFALGVAMTAVLALGVIAGWRCSGSSSRNATVSPGAATSPLGKVAYVLGGDIWVKSLPDGKPEQITHRTKKERTGNDTYSRPAWSPSGEWLSMQKGKQSGVMRRDGNDARFFDAPTLVWSPAADRFAYTADLIDPRLPTREIIVEDADGAHNTVVAACSGVCPISDITWRSDGAEIAYAEPIPGVAIKQVSASGGRPSIYYDNLATPAAGLPTPPPNPADGVGIFDWSSNPTVMLVYHRSNSASITADGALIEETHDGQNALIPLVPAHPVALLDPSLRGTRPPTDLMVLTDGSGRESWTNKRVAIVSRASGTANDITPASMAALQPAIFRTSDALSVAYSAAPDAGNGIGGGDPAKAALTQRKIWIADATQPADVKQRQLTSDPAYRDEFPQFSPDGKQILFARMDAHDEWSLWLIPYAGGDPKQVVPKVDVASVLPSGEPAWFGYYGTIPWHDVFDWWRPTARQ